MSDLPGGLTEVTEPLKRAIEITDMEGNCIGEVLGVQLSSPAASLVVGDYHVYLTGRFNGTEFRLGVGIGPGFLGNRLYPLD